LKFTDRIREAWQTIRYGKSEQPDLIYDESKYVTAMHAFETVMSNIGWNGSKSDGALGSSWNRFQVVYKNYRELRTQARKSWVESTETRALVGRSVELTVSTGLKLEWTPVFDICAPSLNKEERKELIRGVEQRWRLYAESTESDVTGQMTFYQLQRHLRRIRKVEGEYFGIIRYKDTDPYRMSPVSIQLVRPEQVKNPTKTEDIDAIKKRGNVCFEGIELDKYGKHIAYYVYDGLGVYTKIEKYDKKTGRLFMIHGANIEEIGQIRGISGIASYLHECSKLTGYKVAELQAALVNAMIAVWIEPSDSANSSQPLKGIQKKNQPVNETVENAPARAASDTAGLVIQNLKKGEKVQSFSTVRPNVNFGTFHKAIMETMTASEGLAESVVSIKFNSNYSAHRGELLLTWNKIEIEREEENTSLNNPIFQTWLSEMVRSGEITLPGFSSSPYTKNAWCKCDWIGFPKIDIDPTKTVQAAAARVKEGFSTRDRESLGINGTEFSDNVVKLADENKLLYEANKYLQETSVRGNTKPAPVDQATAEPEEGEDSEDDTEDDE